MQTFQTVFMGVSSASDVSVCGQNTIATSAYPSNYGGALWANGYHSFYSNVPGSGFAVISEVKVLLNGIFGCPLSSGSPGPSAITLLLNGQPASEGTQDVSGTCNGAPYTGCDASPAFHFDPSSYLPGGQGNLLQVQVAHGPYAALASATVIVTWAPFSPKVARAEGVLQTGGTPAACAGGCSGNVVQVTSGQSLAWQAPNPMSDWATLLAVTVVVAGKMNCGSLGVPVNTLRANGSSPLDRVPIPAPGLTELVINWNNTATTARHFLSSQVAARAPRPAHEPDASRHGATCAGQQRLQLVPLGLRNGHVGLQRDGPVRAPGSLHFLAGGGARAVPVLHRERHRVLFLRRWAPADLLQGELSPFAPTEPL